MAHSFVEANNRLWDIARDFSLALLDASIWSQERGVQFANSYIQEIRKAKAESITPYTTLIQNTKKAQETAVNFGKEAAIYSMNSWSELSHAQLEDFNEGVREFSDRVIGTVRRAEGTLAKK